MVLEKISIDPVCGMQVKVNDSTPRTTYKGEVYFFCAKHCQHEFESAPQNFVNAEIECCGSCGNKNELNHNHKHHHHGHCSDKEKHTHQCSNHDHLVVEK